MVRLGVLTLLKSCNKGNYTASHEQRRQRKEVQIDGGLEGLSQQDTCVPSIQVHVNKIQQKTRTAAHHTTKKKRRFETKRADTCA